MNRLCRSTGTNKKSPAHITTCKGRNTLPRYHPDSCQDSDRLSIDTITGITRRSLITGTFVHSAFQERSSGEKFNCYRNLTGLSAGDLVSLMGNNSLWTKCPHHLCLFLYPTVSQKTRNCQVPLYIFTELSEYMLRQ